MSVHAVYAEADAARIKAAKESGLDPSALRPKAVPVAFVVRWRQHHSGGDTSHRFRVDEYANVPEAADAANDFDRKVKRHKRANGGFALRWQVLDGAESPDGLVLYADYLRGQFMDYVLTDCSPNSQETYAYAIENRILNVPPIFLDANGRERRTYAPSKLGQTPIHQVTSALVVAWRQDLLARGVGKRAVAIGMEVVRSSFSYAVEDLNLLKESPVHSATKTTRRRRKKTHKPINPNRVVDPDVIETIRMGFILRGRIRSGLAVSLLAYLGFRIRELLGRTWADFVDQHGVAHRHIIVETTVSGGVIIDQLKDGADFRLVKVFEPIRKEIEEAYEALGRPPLNELLITKDTEKPGLVDRDNFAERIKRAQKRLGVNFRVQDLRHTCASLLGGGGDEERGMPWTFTEIGLQLGHSPDVCAKRYSHVVKVAKYRGVLLEQVIITARTAVADAQRVREQEADSIRAELEAARLAKIRISEADREAMRRKLGHIPRRKWRPSSGERRRVKALDLINAGLLEAGERLTGRTVDREFDAILEQGGAIRIADGRTFDTPTGAAAAASTFARNGWKFCSVVRSQHRVTLESLRAQLDGGKRLEPDIRQRNQDHLGRARIAGAEHSSIARTPPEQQLKSDYPQRAVIDRLACDVSG